MGQVHDICDKLPRSPAEPRLFAPSFVDLGFLQRAAQANIWGWASEKGNVPEQMPEELALRVLKMVKRHVQGVGKVSLEHDDDSWVVCFTATGDGGTYTHSFEVGRKWGRV